MSLCYAVLQFSILSTLVTITSQRMASTFSYTPGTRIPVQSPKNIPWRCATPCCTTLHHLSPLNIFSALCVGLNHPRLWWRRGWPRLQRQSHAAQDGGDSRQLALSEVLFHDVMTWYMLRYMQWSIMQSAARSLKFGPVGHLMQLMCQPQVGKGPAAASYSTFAARQEQRRLATVSKFLWRIREEVQTLRKSYVFNDISRIYMDIFTNIHTIIPDI